MLSRTNRLTESDDFRRVVRRGQKAGCATLVVHLAEGEHPLPRAGFVVSKAVGNAVIRNRVKRQLRQLTREHLSVLPRNALLVVRARPAAAGASYGELRGDLARCLERVR
ncbi:MAG: ribonuclease P protein component [Nocardioides sp.]